MRRIVLALLTYVDKIFVVDNASTPPLHADDLIPQHEMPGWPQLIEIIRDEEQPPNLSRLWNVGLDAAQREAERRGSTEWDVIVLNDDVIIPPQWCQSVIEQLRAIDVVAVSTPTIHPINNVRVIRVPGEGGLPWRLCGWAFIMRGEVGLRGDEQLRWWYGDNDIDWTARTSGGIALVPGPVVINELANSTTNGVLAEQAGRDRETFVSKWGKAPW